MNKRTPLTTRQAAELLGRSPATLRSWRMRGKGPAFVQPVPGREPYYLPEVVELWKLRGMEEQEDRRRKR